MYYTFHSMSRQIPVSIGLPRASRSCYELCERPNTPLEALREEVANRVRLAPEAIITPNTESASAYLSCPNVGLKPRRECEFSQICMARLAVSLYGNVGNYPGMMVGQFTIPLNKPVLPK